MCGKKGGSNETASRFPGARLRRPFGDAEPRNHHLGPGCDGTGLEGTLTENGVTVYFEGCPYDGVGTHARFWSDIGPIAEVWTSADGTTTIMLADRELDAQMTEQEWLPIDDVLMSPEGQLAIAIYPRLRDQGQSARSLPLLAVAQAAAALSNWHSGVVVAGCIDCGTAPGCNGCCGLGCSGCTHICTDECEAHDDCIEENAWLGRPAADAICVGLLQAAVASMFACYGRADFPHCCD